MIDYKLWLHVERHNDANDEYQDVTEPIDIAYFDGHNGKRKAEAAVAKIKELYEAHISEKVSQIETEGSKGRDIVRALKGK